MIEYRASPGPLAIAHRGGAGLAPENTLAAFSRSFGLGLRYLETDIRLTRDGQLVAFHDPVVDRVTSLRGPVGRHSLARLQATSVRGGGAVMGLAELLAAFPTACFTVDVKTADVVAPLARLLLDTRAADRVCAAASHGSWLRELRERTGPAITTALPWRLLARLASPRAFAHDGSAAFAHVPLRLGRVPVFRDDLVARAHDAGIRVVVWTVNDAATMHRLLDAGVDGVISDRPDVLREVLVTRGQWHSPQGEQEFVPTR